MARRGPARTIRADDVCAVRRGCAWSSPGRAGPTHRAAGPGGGRCRWPSAGPPPAQHGHADEDPDGTRPTSAMAERSAPGQEGDPMTVMMPPRVKRRRRGPLPRSAGRTPPPRAMRTARRAGLMAETMVTPSHDDADDHRARLEHEGPGRQRDPEPAQQLLEAERRPSTPARGRSATTPAPRWPPHQDGAEHPGDGWRRRCAAAPAPACAGPR